MPTGEYPCARLLDPSDTLHGWVYGVHDDLPKELQTNVDSAEFLEAADHQAVAGVARR